MSNDRHGFLSLDTIGALVLALAWISPLVFALWAAFHTPSAAVAFDARNAVRWPYSVQ